MKLHPSDFPDGPKIQPSDRIGAVVPELAPTTLANADLSNVIVLSQHRRAGEIEAPAVVLAEGERPAPDSVRHGGRVPWTALLAAALLLHFGLVLAFLREPPPLASVGLESISVEIVLGTETNAGLAEKPSEAESVPSQGSPGDSPVETEVARSEPQPQPVTEPEKTEPEKTEPEKVETARREEPQPAQEPMLQAEPEPTPEPEPEPKPAETQAAVEPEQPVTPPEVQEIKPVEEPTEKPVEKKAEKKQTVAKLDSDGSRGIGRGRSTLDRNYPGLVAAHLARHKQYPESARASGGRGTAMVAFSLDGNGRVTSVRLARSSGVASLDAETQAMVRRASPFPAPPSGAGMSFTVPVNFNLR